MAIGPRLRVQGTTRMNTSSPPQLASTSSPGDKDHSNPQAESSYTLNKVRGKMAMRPRLRADVQPPPSQLASTSTPGDAQGEDNYNPQADFSHTPKKIRGQSHGENILKAIAKNGGRKLEILIPDHLARPVENSSLLATGIGIIIRHHAPVMNINRFEDIPSEDKEQIYGGLKAWFDFVDIEADPSVKDKIDGMLQTDFRHWKNKMHVAYNESKNAGHNPIEDCPFDWFEEGVWKVVRDSFEEPKYKRRSDINKENRSKLPYPHTSGSQPFHVRYYRMAEAERSHVKNWRDCHTKKNGCMVNDKAEMLAEEMDTKKRLRYEAGEPVMEEDILADTLGKNTSYKKGMGYGFMPSQPTKRAHFHNSEAMKNAREQLEEQQSQLVRQQTQIENQQVTIEQQAAKIEEANSEINTLNSELGILKEKQMKLEANMEKMLAIFDCK